MYKRAFLTILMVLGLACASYAADIYVNAGAAAGGDGSLATPFQTLQDALAKANTNGTTDIIRIAEGKYTPDPNAAGWTVSESVTILGGYSKLNTNNNTVYPFDYRIPHVCVTVLSGDLSGNDIDVDLDGDPNALNAAASTTGRSDNKLGFIAVSAAATFDGLYFSNFGKTSDGLDNPNDPNGTCINATAAITVKDCKFLANAGASLIVYRTDGSTVSDCYFLNNATTKGSICGKASIAITNSDWFGNSSGGSFSSGVYSSALASGKTLTITDCVFQAASGAPLYVLDAGGTITAQNSRFLGNSCPDGAMYLAANAAGTNVANINYCLLANNSGKGTTNGIIKLGAFAGNFTVSMANNTIASNQDPTSAGYAGILAVGAAGRPNSALACTIKNTILWGNTRDNGTQTAQVRIDPSLTFTDTSYKPFVLKYSDIDTTDAGNNAFGNVANAGLISADPLFADAEYHEGSASPCIDAGEPGLVYVVGKEIFPGHGYRQNMGIYGGTREATNKTNPCLITADSDQNGVVDLSDLSNLRLQWLKSCP